MVLLRRKGGKYLIFSAQIKMYVVRFTYSTDVGTGSLDGASSSLNPRYFRKAEEALWRDVIRNLGAGVLALRIFGADLCTPYKL